MQRTTSLLLIGICLLVCQSARAAYLRVPDPPDVNKPDRDGNGSWPDAGDGSCWQASAAGILGAAGWGDPITIYTRLTNHFGLAAGGLQHQALAWYIGNHANPGTPYDTVRFYFSGLTPEFIGNELRAGGFVGIGINSNRGLSQRGHSLTVWGDSGTRSAAPPSLPASAAVADSDLGVGVDYYDWGVDSGAYYLENYYPTGEHGYVAYAITLTPEPSSAALLMLGVSFTVASRKRR